MSLKKLNRLLNNHLETLAREHRLKGPEIIISEVILSENMKGTRYRIVGEGERKYLRMNSNSYLGLSRNREVIQASEENAHRYGCGPGAVRFISGTCEVHHRLEKALAKFHGREDCILFNSAYSAVMGSLPFLVQGKTVIITDELNHNSIINAARLAAPAGKEIYSHSDMGELEEILLKSADIYERAIIVTDGIFSMRGDHAPLTAIRKLADTFEEMFPGGIIIVMDDSHGIGAFGTTGRGTEEYTGTRSDLLIGTMGKALGVNGGYLVSDSPVISYLRETSPFYIYTNPITPPEAGAALKALEILDSSEGHLLLGHIRNLVHILQEGLKGLELEILESEHPIVPVILRDTMRVDRIIKKLFKKGILATGITYPVVPRGEEEIRLQVTADMGEEDVALFLKSLAAALN